MIYVKNLRSAAIAKIWRYVLSLTPDMCIGRSEKATVRANQALHRLVLLVTLLLSGCGGFQVEQQAAPTVSEFQVAPVFREYYQDLGGTDTLGAPISPLFDKRRLQCQYTLNVLMCWDSYETGAGRFQLYPLGKEIGVYDTPEIFGQAPGQRVIGGYIIYPDFVSLYERLGGEQHLGRPLTVVRYNYEEQRVEQYFERAGFYQSFDDMDGKVGLLPYGAALCQQECRYARDVSIRLRSDKHIRTPFAAALQQWGGLSFSGQPLTNPYPALDGHVEQVYENAVFYVLPDQPQEVRLRPLPVWLGMATTPPGPKLYDRDRNVVFYTVSGDLGYHVPVLFDAFIAAHGGVQVSGNPIAETIAYENNTPRQCFENYCLNLYPNAAQNFRVRPASLGLRYLQMFSPLQQAKTQAPEGGVMLNIREAAPQLPANQPQKIELQVLARSTQLPAPNLPAELKLIAPDGAEYLYDFPVTSLDGKTWLEIPPIPGLPNGSLMAYQVCVILPQDSPVCQNDAYLIWQ